MKIQKEIAEKARQYQKAQELADKLYEELKEYFTEEQGLEGFCGAFITKEPCGEEQLDGEFCDQITLGEDWYTGEYYYPIEDSDEYVGCHYTL